MSNFNLNDSIKILENTPAVLRAFLSSLPESWTKKNEGGESWSPFDIVGHLVHCEKTDWIARARTILDFGREQVFASVDRFAQFKDSAGKTLDELLDEFAALRSQNIETLKEMNLTEEDLRREGIHPEFGPVTLEQLLSTWVVHDLGHIRQTARVLAKNYREEIGPWEKYLPIVREN
jgi:hypothetical protein